MEKRFRWGSFFYLSGFGNFVYQRFNTGELKRRAAWGDGRTKQMYKEIADIVGFQYQHIEGRTFEYAMLVAKNQIEMGKPVVLGCLDMYYLEYYPKLYKKFRVPIHYMLMVGYDEERKSAYILDCGISFWAMSQNELIATPAPIGILGI